MGDIWKDRIDDELRLLRRAEAWEQLNVEEQALRAGYLHRSLPAACFPDRVRRALHALVRLTPVGIRHPHRAPRGEPGTHAS